MEKDALLEWFDFNNVQDSLGNEPEARRMLGLNLYAEMIGEVMRCICDLDVGSIVEVEEIRAFLGRSHAYLTCENGVCEITIKKTPGQRGFKLHSIRFLDIYSAHRSYSVH